VLAYCFAALGCSPIILLGQDLCYSNKKNYVEGAAYYNGNEISESEGLKKLMNKQGQEVFTKDSFLAMRNVMEYCTKMFPQIEFLNGSRDGLSIQGAKDIDFNEYAEKVLLQSPHYDIEDIIRNCCVNQNADISRGQKIDGFIHQMRREISNVSLLSRDLVNLICSEEKPQEKEKQLQKKQSELEKISFYKEVIWPSFGHIWDSMYKQRDYFDKMKVISESMLDKCNVMLDAIDKVYGSTLDVREDEIN
jgi:hypothetical protein